jgi:hypothetical protein
MFYLSAAAATSAPARGRPFQQDSTYVRAQVVYVPRKQMKKPQLPVY